MGACCSAAEQPAATPPSRDVLLVFRLYVAADGRVYADQAALPHADGWLHAGDDAAVAVGCTSPARGVPAIAFVLNMHPGGRAGVALKIRAARDDRAITLPARVVDIATLSADAFDGFTENIIAWGERGPDWRAETIITCTVFIRRGADPVSPEWRMWRRATRSLQNVVTIPSAPSYPTIVMFALPPGAAPSAPQTEAFIAGAPAADGAAPACPVCMARVSNYALPCGHLVCGDCAAPLAACPLCRGAARPALRIFV